MLKADTQKLAKLYQPLPVPWMQWEQIHINFVKELPEDDGYEVITMCIDHFSKMVVLVLLQESDARTVVSCFLAEVLGYHGLTESIISDREPRF